MQNKNFLVGNISKLPTHCAASIGSVASTVMLAFFNHDAARLGGKLLADNRRITIDPESIRGAIFKSVRSYINRGVDECKEEEPPKGLWRSLLWVSTPCEIELDRPTS